MGRFCKVSMIRVGVAIRGRFVTQLFFVLPISEMRLCLLLRYCKGLNKIKKSRASRHGLILFVSHLRPIILNVLGYQSHLPVLSTCPLHTNSGCGEKRHILIAHGDLPRQHSFGTTLRFTGPVPADSRQ